MTTEAQKILADAHRRRDQRAAVAEARPRPDYDAINKRFRAQKSALTRAKNSGDSEKVVLAVKKAVGEWSAWPFNGMWPDDWPMWRIALWDATGDYSLDLDDLV